MMRFLKKVVKKVLRLFKKKPKPTPKELLAMRDRAKALLGKEPELTFDINLDRNNKPVYGAAAADKETLIVCVGEETKTYRIAELGELRLERGVGVVSIEAEQDGEALELARSDMSLSSLYEQVTSRLRAREESKETEIPELPRCKKCGKPVPKGVEFCPECTDKTKNLLRLFGFAKPDLWLLVLSGVLLLVSVGIGLIAPKINRIMVDDYLAPPAGKTAGSVSGLGMVVLALAACGLVGAAVSSVQSIVTAKAASRIIVRIRETLYRKVQQLSLTGLNRRSAGEMITRLSGNTDQLQRFLTNMLPNFIRNTVTLVLIMVILLTENWKLTLLILLPMPPLVVLFYVVNQLTKRIYHREWQLDSEANDLLHDVFSGIREVKVFGTEDRECKRFKGIARRIADTAKRNELIWNAVVPFSGFLLGAGEFIVLYFIGGDIIAGEATLGQMSEFLSYVGILYGPIRWFSRVPRMLANSMTSMTKISEVLDEKEVMSDGGKPLSVFDGEIEFRDASFGYNLPDYVLKHLTLSIHPGDFVGFVGRSGVGKTTAINLIMRMYDVSDGELLIDGKDVREYKLSDYRSQIGVVLQDTYLFNGTVYSNIAYAKPGATRDEVLRAAKLAGAHSFIMKLPDGYHTYVGARGNTLSGGEKQRLAIARAILRDPKLLILDEATSSLDTETEKQIQDALSALSAGRTTVAIAHRLSTLRNATKLAVFEKGELEELGTHEELMQNEGRYYKLVMAQREMNRMAK